MSKIISDYCCNHLGDKRLIEEGIKQASLAGVDIIKFQSFNADNLNKNWPDYQKSYEYYKSVELSREDHFFIIDKCKEYGIEPLFTAFDLDSANLLHTIGQKKVKIASPDADNWELLETCDRLFDVMFISCGMISNTNLRRLREMYKRHTLFYCVSKYPTAYDDIDFDKMVLFDGFSDHTEDINAAKKAIEMGIQYIERHFTLGKYLPGKDHKISSTPDEFRKLVEHRDYIKKCKQFKTRWSGGQKNEP
jgi:N,N'-diacetyllegionaminate synthase